MVLQAPQCWAFEVVFTQTPLQASSPEVAQTHLLDSQVALGGQTVAQSPKPRWLTSASTSHKIASMPVRTKEWTVASTGECYREGLRRRKDSDPYGMEVLALRRFRVDPEPGHGVLWAFCHI